MVVLWQGRGIVVLFAFIVAGFVGVAVTVVWLTPILDNPSDDRVINLALAVSTLISALATYPLGRFVMKPKQDKKMVDPATGQTHVLKSVDTLCFIDMRYWTYIFMLLTVLMLGILIVF